MNTRLSKLNGGARVLTLVIGMVMLFSVIGCNGSNGPVAPDNYGDVSVISPIAGANWVQGEVVEIIATTDSIEPIRSIKFFLDNQELSGFTDWDCDTVMFHWVVDMTPGNYNLYVTFTTMSGIFVTSKAVPVIISGKQIQLLSPTAGSEWFVGDAISVIGVYLDHNNNPLEGKVVNMYISNNKECWENVLCASVTDSAGSFMFTLTLSFMDIGNLWIKVESEDGVIAIVSIVIIQ